MANVDPVALTRGYIAALTARPSPPALERLAVCDEARGTYSVITVGWDGPRRVVGVTLLATIHEGVVTIHHDGIPGFADYLIEHGVPEAQIALAFHPPTPAVA